MRIGYIIPEFPSQTHAFFVREMDAMEEFGHKIFVISTKRPPVESCSHKFADKARIKTYYVYPPSFRFILMLLLTPIKLLHAISYIVNLTGSDLISRLQLLALIVCAKSMDNYCKQNSIEHLHCHSCANAAHMVALCHLLGGPEYSLTLHGDPPIYGQDHASKSANAKFVSVVASPLQESYHLTSKIQIDRLPIITMGVDVEKFSPAVENLRVSTDFLATTVARLHPAKGHELALMALNQLRSEGITIHYQIIGDGPHRKAIENMIEELDLTNQVSLLGVQGEEAVADALRNSNVFILPSYGEASPVSIMEAMAVGIPVIATCVGGVPDMIRNGVNGFLIPTDNYAAIADMLKTLVNNNKLCKTIGINARKSALENFDYKVKARDLERYLTTH